MNRIGIVPLLTWALGAAALVAQEPDAVAIPDDPRAAIAALPIAPTVAGGALVEVLDDRTGRPVAGADVLVLPDARDERVSTRMRALQARLAERQPTRSERELLFGALFGTRYRTDADGLVRVAGEHGRFVVAVAGAAHGSNRLAERTTIRVVAPRVVAVDVTDAAGRPAAGVPLLVVARGGRPFGAPDATTDAAGRGAIELSPHLQGPVLDVVAMVAAAEPVRVPVDVATSSGAPTSLQLPPCGRVRFILYGEDDRPAKSLRSAWLSPDPGDEGGPQVAVPPTELEADGAMFGWVGLGQRVVVRATVDGVSQELRFEGAGPTRAGELVIVDGRIAVGPPILAFRVLDGAGAAVGDERLGVVLRFAGQHSFREVTTDAAGRARLAVPADAPSPDGVYVLRRGDGEGTVHRGSAHRALNGLAAGPHDLGDLRLVDEPVVARGRLVDPAGAPVAGVWLIGSMTITGDSGGGSGQRAFFEHKVRTDDQGRFAVRELAPLDGPLRLRVTDSGWAVPGGSFELALGDREQTVVLRRAGTIAGRLAGDDLTGIAFEMSATDRESGDVYGVRVQDGAFRSQLLPAGTYDVTVGGRRSHFVLEGVVVPPDGEAADPRLDPLDWSAHFRLVRATVRDAQGRALPDALIWCFVVRPGGGRGGKGHHTDRDGRVVLLVPRENAELEVEAEGFARQAVASDVEDLVVAMTPVAKVTLRLRGFPELPDGVVIDVAAQAAGAPQTVFGPRPTRIRDGEAVLTPDRAGRWSADLTLRADGRTRLSADGRARITRLLARVELPTVAFDAGPDAVPPIDVTLTEDARGLLVEVLERVGAILERERDR